MRVSFRLPLGILVLLAALAPAMGRAGSELPLFDAHLHYNWEPRPYLALDQILRLFDASGVAGILVSSRPNDGTDALVAARPPGLWVVPFLRPYRVPGDVNTWHANPATLALIDREYRRGYYVGIGEFHLHGDEADSEVVRKIVAFARDRRLVLHAHSDVAALTRLFAHDPDARIIWAHSGFSLPAAEVERALQRHPNLWAELSYRDGVVDAAGRLTPEWRALFERHGNRFLLGSDTWSDARWDSYRDTMARYRGWLAQLPPVIARRIAWENAQQLFSAPR